MKNARHRDDEDFPAPGPYGDEDIDTLLKSLPVLPRQPDEPGDFQTDDDIPIEIDIQPLAPAWSRTPTRPISKNARQVRELQLAAERKSSEQDGRTPLSERHPGQGRAVRFT